MADIKALAEELVNLTVKEVNELATSKRNMALNPLLQLLLLLLLVQLVVLLLKRRALSMLFSRAQVLLSSKLLRQ